MNANEKNNKKPFLILNYSSNAKGFAFAAISLLFVSLQPIITIARPKELDLFIFATMTCVIEAMLYSPLVIFERNKLKNSISKEPLLNESSLKLNGWKKNKKFLLFLGINFAIAQVLFVLAYELAGAINGALAQQTSIMFAIILGYLINKEKISFKQVIFSFLLIFGLTLAVTRGSFNLIEINLGVLIMLITTLLWMIGHTMTKRIFGRNEITIIQLLWWRTFLSGSFLLVFYLLVFPLDNLEVLLSPINWFFILSMGLFYGFDVFFWYSSFRHIEVSKASVIVSPMPIVTAFLAFLIFGEIFTVFHLIGTLIVIIAIIIIVTEKKQSKKLGNSGFLQ